MERQKPVIYQLLLRLFGNQNTKPEFNGSREINGCGKFNSITPKALSEIKDLGVSHVWYTGIIEHAIVEGYPDYQIPDGNPLVIKGVAGSPYAIKDYYDVNPDLAEDVGERMEEFKALLKRTHDAGLKAIIDFVPNHLAREYCSDVKPEGVIDFGSADNTDLGFLPSNNYYYLPYQRLELSAEIKARFPEVVYSEDVARATGNDQFTHRPGLNDWYETVKLNYGVDYQKGRVAFFDPIPNTWHKMKHILLYWIQQGVDGFRCDMVEMVPVKFWEWVIPQIKQTSPWIVFIGEVYNPVLYKAYIKQGQFDYLYDKVGLYDTLRAVVCEQKTAKEISSCWQNLEGLDKYMLRFLENHDEQRIASRFFAESPEKAIPAMLVSIAMHQGPIMLYFGQEVGEPANGASGFSGDDGRTTIFDYWNVPEHQKWMNGGRFDSGLLSEQQKQLRQVYKDLLSLAKLPAIIEGLFYDLMWQNDEVALLDADKIYAFMRYSNDQQLLVVCNFSEEAQYIRLKVPSDALQMLNIPRPIKIEFSDVFGRFKQSIGSEELINEGVKIQLQAYGYFVMEINV